ncbi:tRNA (guanine-N(7)-)-methyltransferase (tRNA(m7G46)-methyltransferase) [Coemansia sp. RSA 1843]|nr:tRNA (guanine-N(7)-)-methyltransferase (tRNA(m7G46)-methyltransferase) [Coemansia sp. RSA 1843]
MCIAILANVRAVIGYVVLLTVALGCAVTTLLAANIATSYWFQHRRERQRLGPAMDGVTKGAGHHQRERLPLDPPVHRIPRLSFATTVSATAQTTYPTAYNADTWEPPTVDQLALSGYPQVQREVEQLAHLVVRDFVHKWFGEITADTSFPRCVHMQLVQAIDAVAERINESCVDPAELVVTQVLPLATAHIHAVRNAEALVGQQEDTGAQDTAASVMDQQTRVARAYAAQPGIRWHPALLSTANNPESHVLAPDGCKLAVRAHVRKVVDLIVPLVLPPEQSGLAAHCVLVREILTGAVVGPAVASIADPDTVNQLLGSQLERLIREQHMVSELRDALDKQASASVNGNSDTDNTPLSASAMNENGETSVAAGAAVVSYEQFMTSIDECTDQAQVTRIHDDVVAQIRKRRILIMGHGKNDVVHGQRVRDILVYINRLYVAKKKAERRLDLLANNQAAPPPQPPPPLQLLTRPVTTVARAISRASTYYEHRDDPRNLGPPQFTLREILTNVASLSAFAEYMDLIGSQFALEFWVNVEGAKQTARSTDSDSATRLLPRIVGSLWKNYFTVRVDELAALGTDIEAAIGRVQRCLKPHRHPSAMDLDPALLTPPLCREAFELIALVQDAVFRHMQMGVFPSFLRSTIYSRFLKEYYVTPRHDQISASLFAPAEPESTPPPIPPADDSRSQKSDVASSSRRRSLVRSVAGSLGRVRSASGTSASTAPASLSHISRSPRESNSIFRRVRPEAPIVSTDTSQALATRTVMERTGRSNSAVQLAALATAPPPTTVAAATTMTTMTMTPLPAITPATQESQTAPPPMLPQLSRRSTRVDRSEVRRLSASLRSIGLGDAASADRAMSAEAGHHPPIAENPLDDEEGERHEENAKVDYVAVEEPSEEQASPAAESSAILEEAEPEALVSSPPADTNANEVDYDDDFDDVDDDGELSADEAESLVLARVIRTPTPGDLFLDERIEQLARDLERKTHQMAIVRALMRQAESRHKPHEQRVLAASFRGLRREVQAGAEQQRLYETSLEDHFLSATRTRVHIPRAITAIDNSSSADIAADGSGGTLGAEQKTHVVYLIELQQSMPAEHIDTQTQTATGHHAPTGWVVSRRYREFFQMHKDLRAMYAAEMRGHELPSRTPLIRLQRDRDIEHRRVGLQKYIQGLLRDPRIANARPVRLFLSSTQPPPPPAQSSPTAPAASSLNQHQRASAGGAKEGQGITGDDTASFPSSAAAIAEQSYDNSTGIAQSAAMSGWMAQIYKTVGEDIEGITGADSMLEIIVQELGAKVAMQQQHPSEADLSEDTNATAASASAIAVAQDNSISRNYTIVAGGGPMVDMSSAGFIDPLSDLFVEVFGLKNRRNWLRRQAISILLRHIVGGTVERRVRDIVGTTVRDIQLALLVTNLRNTLWPLDPKTRIPGQFQGFEPRTDAQKTESAQDARSKILWFLPRVLGGMVGKKNARDGARLLVDVVQHPVPNLNLVLHAFDVLVASIFPEIKFQLDNHHQNQ